MTSDGPAPKRSRRQEPAVAEEPAEPIPEPSAGAVDPPAEGGENEAEMPEAPLPQPAPASSSYGPARGRPTGATFRATSRDLARWPYLRWNEIEDLRRQGRTDEEIDISNEGAGPGVVSDTAGPSRPGGSSSNLSLIHI